MLVIGLGPQNLGRFNQSSLHGTLKRALQELGIHEFSRIQIDPPHRGDVDTQGLVLGDIDGKAAVHISLQDHEVGTRYRGKISCTKQGWVGEKLRTELLRVLPQTSQPKAIPATTSPIQPPIAQNGHDKVTTPRTNTFPGPGFSSNKEAVKAFTDAFRAKFGDNAAHRTNVLGVIEDVCDSQSPHRILAGLVQNGHLINLGNGSFRIPLPQEKGRKRQLHPILRKDHVGNGAQTTTPSVPPEAFAAVLKQVAELVDRVEKNEATIAKLMTFVTSGKKAELAKARKAAAKIAAEIEQLEPVPA